MFKKKDSLCHIGTEGIYRYCLLIDWMQSLI